MATETSGTTKPVTWTEAEVWKAIAEAGVRGLHTRINQVLEAERAKQKPLLDVLKRYCDWHLKHGIKGPTDEQIYCDACDAIYDVLKGGEDAGGEPERDPGRAA